MKYCINYHRGFKGADRADEFTITYNKKNDALIDFLENFKDKRVNLTIEEVLTYSELKLLKTIRDKYTNLYLRIENYNDNIIEDLTECGIPFFFGNRINNWEEFLGLVELGVTDIYVVEDLCFELDKVAAIAHKEGIQLRTFPNVAQSSWKWSHDVKKFWIRPEDIQVYSDYIDVCEFFGSDQHISILLTIYKENKKWFGDLSEIIIGLNTAVDSRFVVPRFAEKRIRCGKECLKGGKCQICERVLSLSHTLKDAEIMVTYQED
jgi:hypothetical protein